MANYSSSIFVCVYAVNTSDYCNCLSHLKYSMLMDSEQPATALGRSRPAQVLACLWHVQLWIRIMQLQPGMMLLCEVCERTRMRAQYLATTASCTLARLASMSDIPSAASCVAHSGCEARLPSENRAIFAGEPASLASLADSRTSCIRACVAERISWSAAAIMCSTLAIECATAKLLVCKQPTSDQLLAAHACCFQSCRKLVHIL